MSAIDIEPGARVYAQDAAQYGDTTRSSILGLSSTPVIALDDGATVAYFGPNRAKVVDAVKKKQIMDGTPVTLPLDVKMVGRDQLNALGITPEQQASMFAKWMALSDTQRSGYLAAWTALDKSNADELLQFVQSMVESLS